LFSGTALTHHDLCVVFAQVEFKPKTLKEWKEQPRIVQELGKLGVDLDRPELIEKVSSTLLFFEFPFWFFPILKFDSCGVSASTTRPNERIRQSNAIGS
jgi:hypothetical protein